MRLFLFSWHLIYIYVIADSREEALAKIRAPDSTARKEYPPEKYPFVDFNGEPEEEEVSDDMITHFGYD